MKLMCNLEIWKKMEILWYWNEPCFNEVNFIWIIEGIDKSINKLGNAHGLLISNYLRSLIRPAHERVDMYSADLCLDVCGKWVPWRLRDLIFLFSHFNYLQSESGPRLHRYLQNLSKISPKALGIIFPKRPLQNLYIDISKTSLKYLQNLSELSFRRGLSKTST